MNRNKVKKILKGEGYSDIQIRTFMFEAYFDKLKTEEAVIDAAKEWYDAVKLFEMNRQC